MARATNDLQWVRDFIGPTMIDISRTIVMVGDRPRLPARDRRAARADLRRLPAGRRGAGDLLRDRGRPALHAGAGAVRRPHRALAGEHLRHPRHQGVRAGGGGDRVVPPREPRDDAPVDGRSRATTAGLFPVMLLLTGAGTILVLWFGGHDVVNGRITIGQFVQFNTVLALLASQLTTLGWVAAAWQQGIVARGRINAMLHERAGRSPTRATPSPLDAVRGRRRVPAHHRALRRPAVAHGRQPRDRAAGNASRSSAAPGAGKTTLVEPAGAPRRPGRRRA